MNQHTIKVDTNKCIGCGLCVRDCPADNIHMPDKNAVIKKQDCLMCGHCVAICPKAAISITGFGEQATEFSQQTTLDPQQLLHAIKTRRSIRHFKSREIPPEI